MAKTETLDFTTDWEKMRDFFEMPRDEFLTSYSYLTEAEYDATLRIVQESDPGFNPGPKRPRKWVVEINQRLVGYVTIEASTAAEAKDIADRCFNGNGEELPDMEDIDLLTFSVVREAQ